VFFSLIFGTNWQIGEARSHSTSFPCSAYSGEGLINGVSDFSISDIQVAPAMGFAVGSAPQRHRKDEKAGVQKVG
jgi:hypothetical protein